MKGAVAAVTDEVVAVDRNAQGSSRKKDGQADRGGGLAGPVPSHRGEVSEQENLKTHGPMARAGHTDLGRCSIPAGQSMATADRVGSRMWYEHPAPSLGPAKSSGNAVQALTPWRGYF